MNPSNSLPEPEFREIPQQLKILQNHISDLEEVSSRLITRLQPVSLQKMPKNGAAQSPGPQLEQRSTASEIGQTIEACKGRIQAQVEILENATQLLAV